MKNQELQTLIDDLNQLSIKEKANIWKRVAKDLNKPSRIRREVNLTRIERNIKEGEIALIPGKVLSQGEMNKKSEVAAYSFSKIAEEKLQNKAITIRELMEKNPKGNKVRIIG